MSRRIVFGLRFLLAAFSAIGVAGAAPAQLAPLPGQVPAAAPPPAKGTSLVMGQVVDARGEPVAGATVALNGGFEMIALLTVPRAVVGLPLRTLTNTDGRFVFVELPPGTYSLEATKAGFLPGAFGRRRFNGPAQSFQLADGEVNTKIKFQMWEHATIAGAVVDEAGEPIVRLTVRALKRVVDSGLWRWDPAAGVGTTDDRGEFRIESLTPGQYVVMVQSEYNTVPVSTFEAMTAAPTAETSDLTTMLTLQARAAGAMVLSSSAGRYVGNWVLGNSRRSALVVPDPSSDGRALVYPTTFYPAARSIAAAQTLTLASGDERQDVNIRMQLVPTQPLQGTVVGPDGPLPFTQVRLLPDYLPMMTVDTGYDLGASVTDGTGRFMLLGVPAGQYLVRASASPGAMTRIAPGEPAPRVFRADQPVVVGDALPAQTTITLRGGFQVTGRLEFSGTLPKPTPDLIARLFVRLEPLDPRANRALNTYQVNYDRSGAFKIPDVPPGRYLVIHAAFVEERRAMPGWETKGATLDAKDVSTVPLDVQGDVNGIVMTISDHPSQLMGTVREASGAIDSGAVVLLFAADRAVWAASGVTNRRLRNVRASESGQYTVRGIPAGQYFLAAIPDADSANWTDPQFLEAISRSASRITIADSEQKSVDVTTRPVR